MLCCHGSNLFLLQGYVLIYFGIPKKKIVANGAANITIVCKKVSQYNLF